MAVGARFDVLRAGLDRGLEHLVGGRHLGLEDDQADPIEHEGHAVGLAQGPAVLAEGGAHLGGGAVAVVGQRLDDDRRAARAIALVADLLVGSCRPRRRRPA